MAGVVWTVWHGDAVLSAVSAAVEEGLKVAGEQMARAASDRISTSYPPASSPGEPPHKRSGALAGDQAAGSWTAAADREVILSVGIQPGGGSDAYAAFVHGGTSRMAARPWLDEGWTAGYGIQILGSVEDALTRALGRGAN